MQRRMKFSRIGLCALLFVLGCLDEDEATALSAFRQQRSLLVEVTQDYFRAALTADSSVLMRLGTDSARVAMGHVQAFDSALVEAAAANLTRVRMEVGPCAARLHFEAVAGDGQHHDGVVEFRYERERWLVTRVHLGIDID